MVRVRALRTAVLVLCSVLVTLSAQASGREPDSIDTLQSIFASPPREYSTGPLWVWNDRLTEEQIRSTLRDLAGQNVRQAWVHPRPGLMTPYLSEDWFALWKVALDEAERLDMNIWIYDENSYPSGFAGGFVPKAMPESRGLGIQLRSTDDPASLDEPLLAVYRMTEERGGRRHRATRAEKDWPKGEYLVVVQTLAKTSPWFGGTYYVDLLRPGVTEKFLDITMEAYRREVGDQFGKRIPGVFTDEPHLAPAEGLHWTPDLPEQFAEALGLRPARPSPQPLEAGGRLAAGASQLLPDPAGAVHRALGEALLRVLRGERPGVHRPLLGARLADRADRARQHGHVRLAPAPGHRHAVQPVQREDRRPVRQRARGDGAGQRGQPAGPRAHALRGLRRRRLGCALRGHQAHRRLAARPRRQHAQRAPVADHHPRCAQGGLPAELLLSRALVRFLPRAGGLLHPGVGGALDGRASRERPGRSSRPRRPGCTRGSTRSWARSARTSRPS